MDVNVSQTTQEPTPVQSTSSLDKLATEMLATAAGAYPTEYLLI